jgi:hypothetical protein
MLLLYFPENFHGLHDEITNASIIRMEIVFFILNIFL